jgi:hypothetical protein
MTMAADRFDEIADALEGEGKPRLDEETRQFVREWVAKAVAEPVPPDRARRLARLWNGPTR